MLFRQLFSAYWARIVIFKPWLNAVRMEDVTTRQKHTFVADIEVNDANRASRLFQLITIFLAVLLFNGDLRYVSNEILICWMALWSFLLHIACNKTHEVIKIHVERCSSGPALLLILMLLVLL